MSVSVNGPLLVGDCCRCEINESSYECFNCTNGDKPSLFCSDCFHLIHTGGLRNHKHGNLLSKLMESIQIDMQIISNSFSTANTRIDIDKSYEQQKREIEDNMRRAEIDVSEMCVSFKIIIEQEQAKILNNIAQVKHARTSELDNLYRYSCDRLIININEVNYLNERTNMCSEASSKLELREVCQLVKQCLKRSSIITPVLPSTSTLFIMDPVKMENNIKFFLSTMPVNSIWYIGTEKEIKILHMSDNSSHFFVRDVSNCSQEFVNQLLMIYHHKIIDSNISPLLTPIPNPVVGDLCIVKQNNCFLRGLLENTSDTTQIKVFCLDVGESTTIDNSAVFPMDKSFLFHPFVNYFCQLSLANCDLNKTTERQLRWFLKDISSKSTQLRAVLEHKHYLESGLPEHHITLYEIGPSQDSKPLMQRLYDCLGMLNQSIPTQDLRKRSTNCESNASHFNDHITLAINDSSNSNQTISKVIQINDSIPLGFRASPTSNSSIGLTTPSGSIVQTPTKILSSDQHSRLPSNALRMLDLSDVSRPTVPHKAKPVQQQLNASTNDSRETKETIKDAAGANSSFDESTLEDDEWNPVAWDTFQNCDRLWKTVKENTVFYMKLLTKLSSLGTFWAVQQHIQNVQTQNTFDKLFEQLQSYAIKVPNAPIYPIKVGRLCLAVFYSDNSWYRALIQEVISENFVKIRFLDYGNSQVTDSKDLLSLPPEFCQLPFQSLLGSIKLDPKFIISDIRRKTFNDMLQPNAINHFKCTIKRIEGQIHFVQINYKDPITGKEIDVNDEVEISDIPMEDFPMRVNTNWADEMKSPTSVTSTPLHSFPRDIADNNLNDHHLQKRLVECESSYLPLSYINDFTFAEVSQRNIKNSCTQNRHINQQLHFTATPFFPQNVSEQRDLNHPRRQGDRNIFPRRGTIIENIKLYSNERANSRGAGQYARDRYSNACKPIAPYDCIPSLFVKCDIFSGAGNEMVSRIFEKNLSEDKLKLIEQVHLDKKSIGSHVFIETKTHEDALLLLESLQEIAKFDSHPVFSSFAKRYQDFINGSNQ